MLTQEALQQAHSPQDLPNKLRLFILDSTSKQAVRGVPVQPVLVLRSHNLGEIRHDLNVLASDHAGYLSFPIPAKEKLFDEVIHIWLNLGTQDETRVDLLDLYPSLTAQAFLIFIDSSNLPANFGNSHLPSILEPDVVDWRISPSSLSTNDLPIIGENGCEALLPSEVVERVFKFHQLVRKPSIAIESLVQLCISS